MANESTALRALLAAHAPLVTQVGTRVHADRAEQGTPKPFVVFSTAQTDIQRGLDGTEFGRTVMFEIQCWGDTRAQVEQVGDAVEAALAADHRYSQSRSGGYDAELDMEATLITVEWWN